MPLIFHQQLFPEGEIGIWEITEDTIHLLEKLHLFEAEKISLEKMSDRRKREWVSARWLVHTLSGRKIRAICEKDAYGKPFIQDSNFQISISHSQDRTAVIASPYHVGVDIQEIVPKMNRLAQKFVSDDEWKFIPKENDLDVLHIIWGAKEAMYKAWGKREIDFKKNLLISPFEWNGKKANFQTKLIKSNITILYNVIAQKINNYILVYAIEKSRYEQVL